MYEPRREWPSGREVVLVYFGKGNCGYSRTEELTAAVRHAKSILAARAQSGGFAFSARGVSLDWSVEQGVEHLKAVGPFDEISAGRNWINSAAVQYFWRDHVGEASVPQIVLLERIVARSEERASFTVTPEHVLIRLCGMNEIVEWVRSGAPVPRTESVR